MVFVFHNSTIQQHYRSVSVELSIRQLFPSHNYMGAMTSMEKYLIFPDSICNSSRIFWILNCSSTYWSSFLHICTCIFSTHLFPPYIIISKNFKSQKQTYVINYKGRQPMIPGYWTCLNSSGIIARKGQEGHQLGQICLSQTSGFKGRSCRSMRMVAERLGGRRLGEEKGVFNIKSQ